MWAKFWGQIILTLLRVKIQHLWFTFKIFRFFRILRYFVHIRTSEHTHIHNKKQSNNQHSQSHKCVIVFSSFYYNFFFFCQNPHVNSWELICLDICFCFNFILKTRTIVNLKKTHAHTHNVQLLTFVDSLQNVQLLIFVYSLYLFQKLRILKFQSLMIH